MRFLRITLKPFRTLTSRIQAPWPRPNCFRNLTCCYFRCRIHNERCNKTFPASHTALGGLFISPGYFRRKPSIAMFRVYWLGSTRIGHLSCTIGRALRLSGGNLYFQADFQLVQAAGLKRPLQPALLQSGLMLFQQLRLIVVQNLPPLGTTPV